MESMTMIHIQELLKDLKLSKSQFDTLIRETKFISNNLNEPIFQNDTWFLKVRPELQSLFDILNKVLTHYNKELPHESK